MKALSISILLAGLALAGCGGGDDYVSRSAEDEAVNVDTAALPDMVSLETPYSNAETGDAETTFVQRKSTGEGGKISGSQGSISVNGKTVNYVVKGGLITGGPKKDSTAKNGDIEIIQFGASHGGGGEDKDTYFDKNLMQNQGFRSIAVRGTKDKKIEMWIRKNSGQTQVDTPKMARVYSLLVLKNPNINEKNVDSATVLSDGNEYDVPNLNKSGFKVLGYFSDDSVELTKVGDGKLVYQTWGFGDGDGFAMVLYERSAALPKKIQIRNHDAGGRQYVGMVANFPSK